MLTLSSPTPWSLLASIVILSLSVITSATIISTSIQVMASVENSQGEESYEGLVPHSAGGV